MRLALAALPGTPIDPTAPVTALVGGWSSRVFHVAPDWIVRFARDAEAAERHKREWRLLPVVAASVSFAVPVIAHVGMHDGLPFSVHRRVPGSVARPGRISPRAYAAALVDLHDVPPPAVAAAVGVPCSWLDRYERLRAEIAAKVLPVLDGNLASRVARGFDAFLEDDLAEAGPNRLVHADLGAAHILTERDRITGIVDFEQATLGDPAIDLVGIRLLEGAAFADTVIRLHPHLDPSASRRLDFYTWMGAAHAILYGVDRDDPAEVQAGIQGLRRRIGRAVSSAGARPGAACTPRG